MLVAWQDPQRIPAFAAHPAFWKLNRNGLKSSFVLKHPAVFFPWTPTGSNKMAEIQGKGKLLKALQGST